MNLMTKQQAMDALRGKCIALIRFDDFETAKLVSHAVAQAGIGAIEITFTVKDAPRLIRDELEALHRHGLADDPAGAAARSAIADSLADAWGRRPCSHSGVNCQWTELGTVPIPSRSGCAWTELEPSPTPSSCRD